jgi:hypothetical protein
LGINICDSFALPIAQAPQTTIGTAFVYQGYLEKPAGIPLTDSCDFRFGLWESIVEGVELGSSPQTQNGIAVSNGIFAVTNLDFGDTAIDGDARWLAVEVRCTGDADFVVLEPRTPLTPAPHALALPGVHTQQNSISPNIIAGYASNMISPGVVGASILGGGDADSFHQVYDHYGTIGGGQANKAGDPADAIDESMHATVGGGTANSASGAAAVVAGGGGNTATGNLSMVPGGGANAAGGDYSLAAGYRAKVRNSAQTGDSNGDQGTFVWADSQNADFTSTGPNQFLIRATGGVGIGTNAPNKQLSVGGDMEVGVSTVDYRHLRMGGGNSSGFLYGSFPAYGDGIHMGYNYYANAGGASVVPNTGGETSRISTGYGYVSLATGGVNSAPTNRVFVDSVGRVGIGTVGPAKSLHIGDNNIPNSEGMIRLASRSGNSGEQRIWDIGVPETDADLSGVGYNFVIDDTQDSSGPAFLIQYGTGRVGIGDNTPEVALDVVGDINYTGIILDVSDERLKENIAPVQNALDKLRQLRGVYFNMKDAPGQREVGLIAQDVQGVLPEAVRVVEPEGGYLGVSYSSVVPLLVEALKEIQNEGTAADAGSLCKKRTARSGFSRTKSKN